MISEGHIRLGLALFLIGEDTAKAERGDGEDTAKAKQGDDEETAKTGTR